MRSKTKNLQMHNKDYGMAFEDNYDNKLVADIIKILGPFKFGADDVTLDPNTQLEFRDM